MVCLALYNFFQSIISIKSHSNIHITPVNDTIYEWNTMTDKNSTEPFLKYSEDTDVY